MTSELLRQAQRYREIAMSLSPTVQGVQGRDYYLQKAIELESQAGVDASPAPRPADTPAPPQKAFKPPSRLFESSPAPQPKFIKIKPQARVHSYLAIEVRKDTRPNIHRAFSIWLTVARDTTTKFELHELLEFYARETDNHQRNVRRWIDAGAGVFWDVVKKDGATWLQFYGRYAVFRNYNLVIPGQVLLVDASLLLGKLQTLRAALFGCWVNQTSKWASRQTISEITGVHPRTQQNYDEVNNQKKQHTYVLGFQLETSDSTARQMPNRYHAKFYPKSYATKGNRRYGLYEYTSEHNGTTGESSQGVTTGKQRLLFDNASKAIETARKRQNKGLTGQVFAVLPERTKRNNLILKAVDYALA